MILPQLPYWLYLAHSALTCTCMFFKFDFKGHRTTRPKTTGPKTTLPTFRRPLAPRSEDKLLHVVSMQNLSKMMPHVYATHYGNMPNYGFTIGIYGIISSRCTRDLTRILKMAVQDSSFMKRCCPRQNFAVPVYKHEYLSLIFVDRKKWIFI